MPTDIEVSVESFGEEHPDMNPMLLVENARVALAKYHQSPGRFDFHYGDRPGVRARYISTLQILDQKARSNAKTSSKRAQSSWQGCC